MKLSTIFRIRRFIKDVTDFAISLSKLIDAQGKKVSHIERQVAQVRIELVAHGEQLKVIDGKLDTIVAKIDRPRVTAIVDLDKEPRPVIEMRRAT